MPIFESSQKRKSKEQEMKAQNRLPPGQSLTLKWPVLHEGDVPAFDPQTWDFFIDGLVEKPLRFHYAAFMALPKVEIKADFHCVTRWSKFDNLWEGVAFSEVVRRALPRPEAHYVMVHGENGYTANAPLNDLMRLEVVFAAKHNGENLTPEHGWPLRLIVPHLYAWKSVKWVRGLEFMEHDRPGFWEQNGYHIYGGPWKEQRFSSE
jgi:DMSO/TMAO reductase YedYZ molybdopterin-dependent catalytic subunit